jgi:hypothetical protein
MNYFVCKMLNNALKQVESNEDAAALAHAVIQLTNTTHGDHFWTQIEEGILCALIEETRKTNRNQNFSNVIAMMRSDIESYLCDNDEWLRLKQVTTVQTRQGEITLLDSRLTELRVLSKVC